MNELINKLNDIQSEVAKEVMRMMFYLNYGGIAATLTAFGSSSFQSKKCFLFCCLIMFTLGLASAVIMALILWKFAYDILSKANEQKNGDKTELRNAVQNHIGRKFILVLCILSLVFFAVGIVLGFITLSNSL